MYDDQLYTEF